MIKKILPLICLFGAVTLVQAAGDPFGTVFDNRIKKIKYNADDVVRVKTARGVSTLIVLDPTERIQRSGTGFLSACDNTDAEWCIIAAKDDNKVWVKPKTKATFNDLQLVTDKRIYSFEFDVKNTPNSAADSPTYRVVFTYPENTPTYDPRLAALAALQQVELDKKRIVSQLANTPKKDMDFNRVNTNYTMQVVGDSRSIAPTETFDDGIFTYFKFPNNKDVPAIFLIRDDGTESIANVSMQQGTELMVVQKVSKKFVLRLNNQSVGVFNESFDENGIPSPNGTTIESLERAIK